MATDLLLPDPDDDDAAPFWAGCARGELLVQACAKCGARRMPPRPMCPACRSIETRWNRLSGRGTIWSFTVPHPPLLPAYQAFAPYNVITVATDDDPKIRFVGNLVARADGPINEVDPKTIAIGEKVRVVFQAVEDVHLPRWVRA
jgi:uncharacterized OB-fold protein